MKFYDLDFERMADGAICLTQQCSVDEPNVVLAHPEQITFIARQLCGMKPEKANQVADLERRIGVLTDKLQNLVCNSAFRSDLIERLGDGFEYIAKFDGILDLAMEFDGGRLKPEYPDDQLEVASAQKPVSPDAAISQSKKMQSSAIAKALDGNQDLFGSVASEQQRAGMLNACCINAENINV